MFGCEPGIRLPFYFSLLLRFCGVGGSQPAARALDSSNEILRD
jgi:hypothetical protein